MIRSRYVPTCSASRRAIFAALTAGILIATPAPGPGAQAQTAREWIGLADEHYEAGRFAESADAYRGAIAAGAQGSTTFYNAACSAALAGRADTAFAHLDSAITRGWRNLEHLQQDEDLLALHGDARWEGLIERGEEALATFLASMQQPALRTELLEMRRIDQAARRGIALPELEGRDLFDIDTAHTARLKEILEEYGWPTRDLVGEDGARCAWLLAQHADADPAFQRRCLELMRAAGPAQVSTANLAYLTDRVLVNEGKKQIYGTQFWTVDGEMVPRPIADEAQVEPLRAGAGLGTMQDYHLRMTGRPWKPAIHD